MSPSQPGSWSMDERISAFERAGKISLPFTADERGLAWSLAAAFHFWDKVQELPGQCPEHSAALLALDMGITRVRQIRGDIPS